MCLTKQKELLRMTVGKQKIAYLSLMKKLEVHQWRIGIKKDKIIYYYSTTDIFLKERKTVVERKHEHNNMGPVKCVLNSRLNFQIRL